MRSTLSLPTRRPRCDHEETSELAIAGMRRELCVRCGQIMLHLTEWQSEFELARTG